jgi:putative transposase
LLIDIASRKISISHQAELLGISRSSVYYEPVLDEYNLLLKSLIDKQYTLTPFYGSRKMTEQFRRDEHFVNRKHIQRLMREMGLEAIYQKPRLSEPHPGHKIYPYLLRNVVIDRKDQVWASDIEHGRRK